MHAPKQKWARRGSNPRPPGYEPGAPPLSYRPDTTRISTENGITEESASRKKFCSLAEEHIIFGILILKGVLLRTKNNKKPSYSEKSETKNKNSAANRTRTCDMLVNSQPLYQLSYGGNQTRCEQPSHVSCLNRCAMHRIKDYDLEMVLSWWRTARCWISSSKSSSKCSSIV